MKEGSVRFLSDGSVEVDGVKLTKKQVEQIQKGFTERTGWWVVDAAIGQPLSYLGRTATLRDGGFTGEGERSFGASNKPNVVYWGTF